MTQYLISFSRVAMIELDDEWQAVDNAAHTLMSTTAAVAA